MIPSEVAFKVKLNEIERTGRLGSSQGTGKFDNMSKDELKNEMFEAKDTGKCMEIRLNGNRNLAPEDFDMIMDMYRMKFEDVSSFIKNYEK